MQMAVLLLRVEKAWLIKWDIYLRFNFVFEIMNRLYINARKGERNSIVSHTWLVLKDNRITLPDNKATCALNLYNNTVCQYSKHDLENGLILDITADQFDPYCGSNGYYGMIDDFHRSFELDFVHDSKADCLSNDEMSLLEDIKTRIQL